MSMLKNIHVECIKEEKSPLSKVIKEIFLGSLTLLTAQCLREFLISVTKKYAPEKENSKIWALGFLSIILFLITLIVASLWK